MDGYLYAIVELPKKLEIKQSGNEFHCLILPENRKTDKEEFLQLLGEITWRKVEITDN